MNPLFDTLTDEEWRSIIARECDAEDTIEQLFAPLVVDESQLTFDLFDYDGEVEELIDARMDIEFWRGGC